MDTGPETRPMCHADPGSHTDAVSPDFRPGLFVKRVSEPRIASGPRKAELGVKLVREHPQRFPFDLPFEVEWFEDGVEQFVASCILDGCPHDLFRGDAGSGE